MIECENVYFTYLIGWSKSDIWYYGVRYKDNSPPETLWLDYFTSSKYVAQYRIKYGEPDVIQIRKTFTNKKLAKNWEDKVLRRMNVQSTPKWLNKSNNNSFYNVTGDADIGKAISDGIKKSKKGVKGKKCYNNGLENKFFTCGTNPDGWVKGKLQSEQNKAHMKKLNSEVLTKEKRLESGKKHSLKTTGKPKPPDFGKKVSEANKGKSKPHTIGDNNVSRRPDVKEKISNKMKGRKFFTDGSKLYFVRPDIGEKNGWILTSTNEFKTYENK